jgi:hypothetical protein
VHDVDSTFTRASRADQAFFGVRFECADSFETTDHFQRFEATLLVRGVRLVCVCSRAFVLARAPSPKWGDSPGSAFFGRSPFVAK